VAISLSPQGCRRGITVSPRIGLLPQGTIRQLAGHDRHVSGSETPIESAETGSAAAPMVSGVRVRETTGGSPTVLCD